ncbi:RNA polymerase sigma factor [Paenibacillus puldeungensis]|uniref:RNA polymerase sigma factor n=1 Tax=Paenibacillus puldeungensis TaxID=696536 RepID=A0ABW3RS31_9BACL
MKERFIQIYNESFEYVYSFVYSRTAGNRQVTEEIVQETFGAAWLTLDRFRQNSSYRTWLCSIAKNKLYAYYRKNTASAKYNPYEENLNLELPVEFNPEAVAESHETRAKVREALNQINPLYRYALILKYIDGYSCKEIAGILGRTNKAVDGILQKARGNFIKEYTKCLEGRQNANG